MEYLKKMAPHIPGTTLVMDCCGVKQEVCKVGFELAQRYGFTFVGGHPMAGTQYSGFATARRICLTGPMVIVLPRPTTSCCWIRSKNCSPRRASPT